jgi:hypothetical protein
VAADAEASMINKSQGAESSRQLHRQTDAEERKVEAEKGSDLRKGKDRVEERSKSSDGQSAGEKQRQQNSG